MVLHDSMVFFEDFAQFGKFPGAAVCLHKDVWRWDGRPDQKVGQTNVGRNIEIFIYFLKSTQL